MKVAIPTENMNGLKSIVYGHFGSAPYYAVFEAETGALRFIDNGNKEHEHGQCQPADGLIENQVEAVVCGSMGIRAVEKLNALGMKVYYAENALSVDEIIMKYKKNELDELSAENACRHSHCN